MWLSRLEIKPLSPSLLFLGIFTVALALRLIFVAQWMGTPYGADPVLDAQAYHEWAKAIAGGQIFRGKAFYLSPLLPYLLGIIYAIFGSGFWVAPIFNAVLGAITSAVVALTGERAFGRWAGLAAGLLASFYKPFIFYTAPIMKEILVILFFALFVHFIFEAYRSGRLRWFLFAGLALGICTIVRGNVLFFAPAVVVALAGLRDPRWLRKSGYLAAGMAIAILPITLHNAIASHDFVLLSYSDGFNAYIGHNASSTGTSYNFPAGIGSSPQREEFDVSRLAEDDVGHALKPSGVSRYWRDKAIGYALSHPGRETELLGAKIRAFWSNDEPFDNYDMRFVADNFTTLMSWPLVGFGAIVFLAVFGGVVLFKPRRREVIFFAAATLFYMVSLFPFYVTDRYRLPAVLCFLPLSGAAIPALAIFLRARTRLIGYGGVAAGVVALLVTLLPPEFGPTDDSAYNWSVLSTLYQEEGQAIPAIEAFNKALSINPARVGSDAWIRASEAEVALGDPQKAEQALVEAMRRYPGDGSVTYNYGRLRLQREDYKGAMDAFQKAIAQMPTFTQSYRGLAVVYNHFGDNAKAMQAVATGLSVVPNDPGLLEVRGQLIAAGASASE